MPRIGVRDRQSGKVYYIRWDKPKAPSYEEAMAEVERELGRTPSVPGSGPMVSAPEPHPNAGRSSIFSSITGDKRSNMGLSDLITGEYKPQPSVFDKITGTMWGNENSQLPAVPGVTRPILPEMQLTPKGLPALGLDVPNQVGEYLYNEVVRPSTSAIGAASDWATGKALGAVARPAIKYVGKPLYNKAASIFGKGVPEQAIVPEVLPPAPTPPPRREPLRLPEKAQSVDRRFLADERGNLIDIDADWKPVEGPLPDPQGPVRSSGIVGKTRIDTKTKINPKTGQEVPTNVRLRAPIRKSEMPTLEYPPPEIMAAYPESYHANVAERARLDPVPPPDLPRSQHSSWRAAAAGRKAEIGRLEAEGFDTVGYRKSPTDASVRGGPVTREYVGRPDVRKRDWSSFKHAKPVVQQAQRITTVADQVAKTTKSPEIRAAAQATKSEPSVLRRAFENFKSFTEDYGTKAITRQIADKGPAGQEIARRLSKFRESGDQLAGTWIQQYDDMIAGVDKTDYESVVDAVAGKKGQVLSPRGQKLYDEFRHLESQVLKRAHEKKASFSFNDLLKRVMHQHDLPKDAAITYLKAKGIKPKGAISPLTARKIDLKNWKKSPDSIRAYLYDMAQRVSMAEELGPKGLKSDLMKGLVKQTSDPQIVKRNLNRVLKAEIPKAGDAAKSWVARVTIKGAALSHLSQFAISNFNQNIATVLRSNTSDFVKAVGSRLGNKKEFYRRAQRSGVFETTMQDIYRESGGSQSKIANIFGIRQSEQFNRALASETGRNRAARLFKNIKANPKNTKAKDQLKDLLQETDEGLNALLKQKALPEETIARAGGRQAEITQGRAQAQDVPYEWTNGPARDAVVLYKKYAFRQGRILLDSIKENPKRNIPLALLLYQAGGELTGDLKAGIRAVPQSIIKNEDFSDQFEKELSARGEWIGKSTGIKNPILNRVIDNYLSAWLLGLPGDVLQAVTNGREEILRLIVGPVNDEIASLLAASYRLAQGKHEELGRYVTRKIPFFGSGIQRSLFPTRRQSESGRKLKQ